MFELTRDKLSDGELLLLLKADDESALAAIYSRYWRKLYLQAYNILRDQCLSEDIVQEIMVQLWVKRSTMIIESLQPYLYTAVRFQVFKAVKAQKSKADLHILMETEAVDRSDASLNQKDIQWRLEEGIKNLPDKCREIFTLSRKEYLSTKEIARRLDLAPKTVENQITIALRRLRTVLNDIMFLAGILFISFNLL